MPFGPPAMPLWPLRPPAAVQQGLNPGSVTWTTRRGAAPDTGATDRGARAPPRSRLGLPRRHIGPSQWGMGSWSAAAQFCCRPRGCVQAHNARGKDVLPLRQREGDQPELGRGVTPPPRPETQSGLCRFLPPRCRPHLMTICTRPPTVSFVHRRPQSSPHHLWVAAERPLHAH